jgi:hypothetical protein
VTKHNSTNGVEASDPARGLSGEAWSAVTKQCFDCDKACADVRPGRCTLCPNKKAAAGVIGRALTDEELADCGLLSELDDDTPADPIRAALDLLDESARLHEGGYIEAHKLANQARELLRGALGVQGSDHG